MKQCAACGAKKLVRVVQAAEVRVGRRTFAGDVEARRCSACGETFTSGEAGEVLELAAARWLVDNGFSSGEEIRFLRKVAGLRAVDLAELLDVSAEAVSHWETGKHHAARGTLATLGALVVDALCGSTATRDRLRALRSPPRLAKVRLDLVGPVPAANG